MTEHRLDNGLTVLLVPDASRPTVTTCLTVRVGSRQERAGEYGLAHFLEHLLFKSTERFASISDELHARGARFNGTTWFDRTNYFETLPAEDDNLAFALQLAADRLARAVITEDSVAAEKTVVLNELDRGENRPTRVLYQRMMAATFDWHPYRRPTIGNRDNVGAFEVEDVRRFYARWYRPDNSILVLAGAFDPAGGLAAIETAFAEVPRRTTPGPVSRKATPPTADGERSVVLRRVGDVGAAGVAYRVPAAAHADYVALKILDEILTASPFGRLYRGFVETGRASSVSSAIPALHDPTVLYALAEPNAAADPDPETLRDELIAAIEGIADDPVTDDERDLAVHRLLKHLDIEQDDLDRWAVQLGHWAAIDDWRTYVLRESKYESVTTEDVARVARAYLHGVNRTAGVYVPVSDPERVEIPDVSARVPEAQIPATAGITVGESLGSDARHIESRVVRGSLTGGARIAVLPKKTRGDAVHVRLTLRYGHLESLCGQSNASRMLPWLMMRGPRGTSRVDFQRELDRLRTRLSASGGPGWATFSVRCRSHTLKDALELLGRVVRKPALEPTEFATLKTSQLTSLAKERTDPGSLTSRGVSRALNEYPAGDPRAVPTLEEAIAEAERATVTELTALHDAQFQGSSAVLSAVGPVDVDALQDGVASVLDDWTSPIAFTRLDRTVAAPSEPRRIVSPVAEKDSLSYVSSQLFPLRDDEPDFARLSLGNHVLGAGSLSSRLGIRVRREEGLSYSIASSFSASSLDRRATFGVRGSCASADMERFEQVVGEELNRFVAEGVTSEELERSRHSLLQRRRAGRTDDSALVRMLETTIVAERDLGFTADLDAALETATVDEVNDALRCRLDPARLVVAVAGDVAPTEEESAD